MKNSGIKFIKVSKLLLKSLIGLEVIGLGVYIVKQITKSDNHSIDYKKGYLNNLVNDYILKTSEINKKKKADKEKVREILKLGKKCSTELLEAFNSTKNGEDKKTYENLLNLFNQYQLNELLKINIRLD